MAQHVVENVQLRLMYELGEDDNGKLIYRTKNYNNIKVDAETAGLLQAAEAISSLQETPVSTVKRSELHFLIV
ncbi:DUF1659 domain-containing protein [Sutcliffiella rhizosphaerae]|uniref:DUF1659 domain-containing protein n=1 Tax=Sutcliffiella rhizosphaerae TaxID=2880967 RepID=A0ABM8YMY5_9BACI|nr:DUF1659 domain-containing protein [Sutcliffiella rhizosphaerae]CAG9621201.1 hypothetical protein BACCIP111883_01973 [Sutcliffiella rhizosphaerae]